MMIDFTVGHLIEQTRKKDGNPGGGAIVSLIGNLGINLLLMMDNSIYDDNLIENEAKIIRKKLLCISDKLEKVMQDDIDKLDVLIKACQRGEEDEMLKKKTIDLIGPPIETIKLVLEAMKISDFILQHGKIEKISDGEIATRLMKEAVISSIVNIEINQKHVDYCFDKEKVIKKCQEYYNRNKEIIKGRNR